MAANHADVRFSRLEGAYEQIDQRLGALEHRMDRIEQRLDRLEDKMDRQFQWIVGLILISIILPIALHFVPP